MQICERLSIPLTFIKLSYTDWSVSSWSSNGGYQYRLLEAFSISYTVRCFGCIRSGCKNNDHLSWLCAARHSTFNFLCPSNVTVIINNFSFICTLFSYVLCDFKRRTRVFEWQPHTKVTLLWQIQSSSRILLWMYSLLLKMKIVFAVRRLNWAQACATNVFQLGSIYVIVWSGHNIKSCVVKSRLVEVFLLLATTTTS